MSAMDRPNAASSGRVAIAAGRLWAGGVATGCVAALVAVVGVMLCSYVFDVKLVRPPLLLPIFDSLALNYAATAFVLALVATAVAHLLSLTTPRPRTFFNWIVGLVTVAAMVVPFALDGSLASKISTSLINMVIGISIGSLLTAVLSRTVIDTSRSWQQP